MYKRQVWTLAEETQPSDAADYDVTDYAFPFTPVELYAADTPPRLQTLSGNTGEFYAGQTVYAYSVHDDVQIASLKNYGAIYATRHYINEHVVYCLEHTMNSHQAMPLLKVLDISMKIYYNKDLIEAL